MNYKIYFISISTMSKTTQESRIKNRKFEKQIKLLINKVSSFTQLHLKI